ncbi:MAG TPA: type II toxin-antitoxin system ParD family antitoxin [Candidatus Margulisiibacteriota bacterium]|nr:type II toxin-antitoxin system ParD family antitoxin [Candidatus Margulisiibacteriota bacterium]
MAIHLAKEIEAEINAKLRSGRYRSANAVIRDGLALIEAREALRQAVRDGEAQLARGRSSLARSLAGV